MSLQKKHSNFVAVLLVGLIVTAVTLGGYFQISPTFITIFVVIAGLILATVLLWSYANRQATGSEWWQDDTASGWRGY